MQRLSDLAAHWNHLGDLVTTPARAGLGPPGPVEPELPDGGAWAPALSTFSVS